MTKVKHTKNELKRQKDALKRYTRYLPTLLLKKKQLQTEQMRIIRAIEEMEERIYGVNLFPFFKHSIMKSFVIFIKNPFKDNPARSICVAFSI